MGTFLWVLEGIISSWDFERNLKSKTVCSTAPIAMKGTMEWNIITIPIFRNLGKTFQTQDLHHCVCSKCSKAVEDMGHRSPVPTYQKFAQDIDQFWSFKSAVPHWCNFNLCRSWLIESERSPNSSCPRNPSTTAKWPFFKYRSHSEYHWTHKKQQCLPSGKSTKQKYSLNIKPSWL